MGTKSEKVCMCVCVCVCVCVCMYVCMYVCDAFLLASISPYISKVRSHFWLKFGMMPSIYRALMLLNFCGNQGGGWRLGLIFLGFQIEENFWEAKF